MEVFVLETAKYKRVVLKLSGESLAGDQGFGINPAVVEDIAAQVKQVREHGIDVAIVVGGGNIWRGLAGSAKGMDRATADYMGMMATVMNALALQDALEKIEVDTRVQTAIEMRQVAENYIPLRAIRHMEKGRVVIFGAGAGMPYFSTDTVAVQRTLETRCDEVLMGKNGVDGVYSADPHVDPDARKLDTLTYSDALQHGLKVVDSTAFSLCMDNDVTMRVFGMGEAGNVTRALLGENIGTVVTTR